MPAPLLALIVALAGLALAPAPALAGGLHPDRAGAVDALEQATATRRLARVAVAAPNAPTLPRTWCGAPRTGPARAEAVAPGAPSVQLAYAHAADQPDRFAAWAHVLQRNAAVIGEFLAGEAAGTRTLRFATGTGCGPGHLDLVRIRLPRARAAYVTATGGARFAALEDDVLPELPPEAGPRHTLVVVDDLLAQAQGVARGLPGADQPGRANPTNRGGGIGFVFAARGFDPARAATYQPKLFLHEIGHMLGAVQPSAPHGTGTAGHCTDEADVMCYDDGTVQARSLHVRCAARAGAIDERFDCGSDDYFNPAPAPGSYLARHWNVYDSAFLATCSERPDACATAGAPAAAPPARSVARRPSRPSASRSRRCRSRSAGRRVAPRTRRARARCARRVARGGRG